MHHRHNTVPPIVLGLVLLTATIAAILPLAVVLGAVHWQQDTALALVIGAVAIFAILFPFGFRYVSRERPT